MDTARKGIFSKSLRPASEPFVWLTAMGLTLGLAMIILLLGTIVIRGIDVFWPKPVVEVTLKKASAGISGSPILAGVITKQQKKIIREIDPIRKDGSKSPMEWQLFVGNKDLYGFSFKFIDYSEIQEEKYPKDIIQIKRLEYGDAFGFPISLRVKGGEGVISAGDVHFATRLRQAVQDANKRWKQIKEIEKKEIGFINHKMTDLRQNRKALEEKISAGSGVKGEQQLEAIDHEIDRLQKRYEVLAQKARLLRDEQTQSILTYELVSGQKKELPIGHVVDFYYPNQLSFWDRAVIFFKNLFMFMVEDPREANTEGGIFPAIFGTFVMTVLMSVAVTPFGVLAAIYLREYAKQGFFVRAVRIAVNNLAGVPSIVFGVFGLGFFVYFAGSAIDSFFFSKALPTPTFGTGGIFWASLTLALLTVPVVIVATEEALASVPRSAREGSLACGASKWQTIQRIVLPAAAPGILTGLILAMARGAGEVAPLMIVGVVKLAPNLPIDGIFPFVHLERKFMHLGFHIYDLGFQSPDSDAAKPMVFATTLFLIGLVVLLNLGAIFIRERLRKRYTMSAF